VHVVARADIAVGHADHGVVLAYLLAARNRARGNLVAGRHLRAHAHVEVRQMLAQRQVATGDQDVVVGVQANDGV
jgi:hypothetical protein